MYISIAYLSLITVLATLSNATPMREHPPPQPDFLLVTTTQSNPEASSADLANVNATSLFDPFDQTTFLLRLIGPGYESLPRFNFSRGGLHTLSEGIEGQGLFVYNSTTVEEGGALKFLPEHRRGGNLRLNENYLLAVDNEYEGWTICDGAQGEQVISWKGTGASCVATFIQAVQNAPY